jgi:two-component system, chemotaxis family, protein-glutamate methylesterase/glutaminase
LSAPVRVFALLGDAPLRRRLRMQWRSNGISLCAVHAAGGEFLAEELGRLQPQVIIADAEVDGAREFIQAAARRYRIPVIGLVRDPQSLAALHPLEWGAVTLVPGGRQNPEALMPDLEAAVEQCGGVQVVELLEGEFPLSGAFPDAAVFDLRRTLRAADAAEKVVVIAGGLGGPMAVRRILTGLAGRQFSPIVYTQRIAPPLAPLLGRWLEQHTGAQVQSVCNGQKLEVGHVYLAARADEIVRIERHADGPWLRTSAANGKFQAADALLESAAATFGARALGVVLSGHGRDGCRGLLALRAAGGLTITQDRASSPVYELPGLARDDGGAIECLPINEIAERIHMLMHPEPATRP